MQTGELAALKEQIRLRSGLFCGGYKENCFRRRVAVRMRARGVSRYADYARLLDHDPPEYERLLRAVTINVSRFFRNAEVWDAVRDQVLPRLRHVDGPAVNVWSAGTAAGEEAYTLAMVVREAAERGSGPDPERVRIIGTDLDPDALAAARQAEYGALALGEMTADRRRRWFEDLQADVPRARPVEEIRRMVRFWRHDLLADVFPRGQHLIVCRNAVIYFERPVQEAVFDRFLEALAPGGFLVMGKAETLVGPVVEGLEAVSVSARIYRKREP